MTAGQLRSAQWIRLFRDVYIHRTLPRDPLTLIRAAALLLPKGGAVGGRAAALLHGARLRGDPIGADGPIELVVPAGALPRRRDGLLIRQAEIDPVDVTDVDGIPTLIALRVAFDLARAEPDLDRAAAIVRALARIDRRRKFRPEALLDYAAAHPGGRGVRSLPEIVERARTAPVRRRRRSARTAGG